MDSSCLMSEVKCSVRRSCGTISVALPSVTRFARVSERGDWSRSQATMRSQVSLRRRLSGYAITNPKFTVARVTSCCQKITCATNSPKNSQWTRPTDRERYFSIWRSAIGPLTFSTHSKSQQHGYHKPSKVPRSQARSHARQLTQSVYRKERPL